MKLSRQMRATLNRIPDAGSTHQLYASSLEPLYRRGLVSKPRMVRVMVEVFRYETELTEKGLRIKYQNTDD